MSHIEIHFYRWNAIILKIRLLLIISYTKMKRLNQFKLVQCVLAYTTIVLYKAVRVVWLCSGLLDLIPVCACVRTHNTKQFLNTSKVWENSILILSAWRRHQIPHVKGFILQKCPPPPTPDPGCKPQAVPCASDLLATDWRFPQPRPYSINLLELLIELRKTLLLPEDVVKDTR